MIKANKTIIAVLATTVLAATGATAFAEGRGGGKGMFERADTDNSGDITLAEFQAPMTKRFTDADANSDGILTVEEVESAIEEARGENRRGSRGAKRMFKRFDINGDDQLTLDEMNNRQAKMFALMDLDDSGAISEEEAKKRMGRGGGKRRGERGSR